MAAKWHKATPQASERRQCVGGKTTSRKSMYNQELTVLVNAQSDNCPGPSALQDGSASATPMAWRTLAGGPWRTAGGQPIDPAA